MTRAPKKQLLELMKRIRLVEETIADRYPEGKMRCPTHLSIGQEAVAAGVGLALRKDDLAVSGHRAHAHYLAKGGSLPAMIAEIYGKVTGCARGKGGSMHLVDESVGFMGSTAIVGGTVPVGVGLAYGIKHKRSDQVSCVFLGEAVTEAGVFFESVNFAVLKRLPVLFVCENNLYSVYSPLHVRQPEGREITRVATALGLHAEKGDGNDVLAVHTMVEETVARIRSGAGPQLLEFSTYRWREHCGPFYDNDLGYRTEAEFVAWKAKDPVGKLQAEMLKAKELRSEEVNQMEKRLEAEVRSAFEFAEASPFPDPEDARSGLFAEPAPALATL